MIDSDTVRTIFEVNRWKEAIHKATNVVFFKKRDCTAAVYFPTMNVLLTIRDGKDVKLCRECDVESLSNIAKTYAAD